MAALGAERQSEPGPVGEHSRERTGAEHTGTARSGSYPPASTSTSTP